MTLLEGLFLTTWGLWTFFGLCFVLFLFCVEYERPSLATILLIAIIAILQVFSPYPVATWAYEEPFKFILFLLAYVAIGVIWSCLRWVLFVKSTKRRFVYAYDEYMKKPERFRSSHDKTQYSAFIRDGMRPDNWYGYDYGLDDDTFKPLISKNKSRFMLWLAYWPTSMFWTVLNDPIRRAFDSIYYGLAKHLQGYSDKIFGDVPVYNPPTKTVEMNEDDGGPGLQMRPVNFPKR